MLFVKDKLKQKNMIHELKTWPTYFRQVVKGVKEFEIRKDDRKYRIGDTLLLKEYQPASLRKEGGYTGRECKVKVKYILRDAVPFGVSRDFIVMPIKLITQ